ncbi:putative ATP-binding cassette transporter [Gemmobacter megaterium]|uniref:Putative ATP-binding cassette transporter n=1 Tax=Gemmobacter megaterium TaxID=1086013 RepID=A0A1N7NEE4_9RHOB|nr:SbmA/BacA-like family transporter [Gemmobacter megaterium]GGE14595.1 ABC transporter permease [Gemmobacter megaterium]SIS96672.1 putative ATP-binding cassette transporter [Gemmobacter megaterium]
MAVRSTFRATLVRAIRLARIVIAGPGAWQGLALYALVLGLSFVGVWVSVRLIAWNKAFYDALEQMDAAAALTQIGVFFALVALSAGCWLTGDWFRKKLLILWRARLTARALDLWIGNRAYWLMRPGFGTTPVENPDQRVAEDCRLFIDRFIEFTLDLVSEVVSLVSYVAVLWSVATFALGFTLFGLGIEIPRYMVWLAPVYVVVATAITHLLGRPLKRQYFDREKVEADFRHALVQLRDRADTVAQSGGEGAERRRLDDRFAAVALNWRRVMRAELILGLFSRPYFQTVLRMPTFFALPAYFAGALTLGGLMQLASAFSSVTTTLSWFIFEYRKLAEFVAVCERLDGLFAAAQAPAPLPAAPRAIQREVSDDGALRLDGLRLATPAGNWLDPVPHRVIRPGKVFLITGASGRGKTTLLAAIAGLWPWGHGRIERPAGRFLFLPAGAPVLGDGLVTAACHPDDPDRHDPARVFAVLTRLGLAPRLTAPQGEAALAGLSMGERQRLGLARAVLNRPDWLLMDEATSALDPAAEADLLAWLRTELPDTTLIIVAHRTPLGVSADDVLRIGPAEPERKSA